MKKLLFILLALGSMSVFANESKCREHIEKVADISYRMSTAEFRANIGYEGYVQARIIGKLEVELEKTIKSTIKVCRGK